MINRNGQFKTLNPSSSQGQNAISLCSTMTLASTLFVQIPWHVPCGGACYGDGNLVFVANDWHTALVPVYLQAYYRDNGYMNYTRSVLVIHNMAHQVSALFHLEFVR